MKIASLISFVFAGLALLLMTSNMSQAQQKKNVLFLIADDLNCDLHCYGHPQVQSPRIDSLAQQGVLFERAYCQFPLCSPSRSSFLTGRRPNENGVLTNPRGGKNVSQLETLSPNFREYVPETVTLPQLFRKNGYRVARVGKLYHYGVPNQIGTSGLDDPQSWDFVVNPAGRDKAEEHLVTSLITGNFGGTLSWLAAEGTDLEQTDGLTATSACSLLESFQDQPFFLAVGFFRPHTPYVAPKAYYDAIDPRSIPLPQLSEDDRQRLPAPAYLSGKKEQETMNDGQRRAAIQAYHASISFMDAQVGRVLDALDRLKLRDNTIVVMTSDHGYHMYEHGLWQKQSLFENSARVPLIISAPGMKGNGQKTQALAELVDLYPTLAGLCELKAPDYLDGVSLQPVLEDPARSVKQAAFTQVRRGNFDGHSVRTDRWRYTRWDNGSKGEQLFDMQADPGESRNLAGDSQHAAVVAELKGLLQQTYSAPPAEPVAPKKAAAAQ
ncbi:sulfatase [Planctomicrobium piriforme]|uniref:Arylsulfatase A n=1 Tax=Planctomicrobium piriforme TaxID=1576369 RepID=A0A1I3M076_9PLAN|nr:sulfatase [Planctomicrobium piriforme]SFI90190.1 Arylsulfatase A [Planctomicrobium piriforme]